MRARTRASAMSFCTLASRSALRSTTSCLRVTCRSYCAPCQASTLASNRRSSAPTCARTAWACASLALIRSFGEAAERSPASTAPASTASSATTAVLGMRTILVRSASADASPSVKDPPLTDLRQPPRMGPVPARDVDPAAVLVGERDEALRRPGGSAPVDVRVPKPGEVRSVPRPDDRECVAEACAARDHLAVGRPRGLLSQKLAHLSQHTGLEVLDPEPVGGVRDVRPPRRPRHVRARARHGYATGEVDREHRSVRDGHPRP